MTKRKEGRPVLDKECVICGNPFQTRAETRKTCSAKCKAKIYDSAGYKPRVFICATCGKEVITNYSDKRKKFCSQRCHDRPFKEIYKETRKRQMKQAYVEPVVFKKLYKRDNGICQICGKPVGYDRKQMDVWGATVDHIIPMSLGGKHCMDNCQLAHRGCNSLKGQEGAAFKIDDIDAVAKEYGWTAREAVEF